MMEIAIQINTLKNVKEKELLSTSLEDAKKYIARKDVDALKALLSKLSRYHTRFSPQAQKVSQKLAVYITEGMNKL